MRKRLNKQEVKMLDNICERLNKIYRQLEDRDVELHYGNGTVVDQIGCACAALETILQEY